MPLLDIIPQDDWGQYYQGAVGHWRYEWNFNLIHTNPGGVLAHSSPEPFLSPGTSGGILAMRKDWFQKLGLFDTGMHEGTHGSDEGVHPIPYEQVWAPPAVAGLALSAGGGGEVGGGVLPHGSSPPLDGIYTAAGLRARTDRGRGAVAPVNG